MCDQQRQQHRGDEQDRGAPDCAFGEHVAGARPEERIGGAGAKRRAEAAVSFLSSLDAPVKDGDEIAIVPAIAGG